MTATDAMGLSWEALRGQMVSATVFHIVVSLLAGVGSCLCCVGLLLTAMHMTLLGALLALTPRPLYEHAGGLPQLTPLEDRLAETVGPAVLSGR